MRADEVSDIRITDPYIKKLVADEQRRRGIKTATRMAGVLILERFTTPMPEQAIRSRRKTRPEQA